MIQINQDLPLIAPKSAINIASTADGQLFGIERNDNLWSAHISSPYADLLIPITDELVAKFLDDVFAQKNQSVEIERRWLARIPDNVLLNSKQEQIQQWYLLSGTDEYGQNIEVRLRQKNNEYMLAMKKGSGLVRREVEGVVYLDSLDLEKLSKFPTIRKTRFISSSRDIEAHTIEYNRIFSSTSEVTTAEVEFVSLELSNRFNAPLCFGQEVTDNPNFDSCNMARLES